MTSFIVIPSPAGKENGSTVTPVTSGQSCTFTALGMQGHQVLFLSNTDCSLFVRVLSLFELRTGDGGESVNFHDNVHTPASGLLKALQTPAAVMDRRICVRVIRNQFDQC